MGSISAQSLELTYKGEVVTNDQEITLLVDPSDLTMNPAAVYIAVKNMSADPMAVMVRKYDVSLLDSTSVSFCWNQSCYGPNTYLSPEAMRLESQESTDDFHGDYYHNGINGHSIARFTFFNEGNPNDSTSVVINYIVGPLGIDNLELTYNGDLLTNDQEITLMIDPLDDTMNPAAVYIVVKNTSTDPMAVMVRKYDVSLLDSTSVSFCWNQSCYGPNTYLSPEAMRLDSQESTDDFHGDYYHNKVHGKSIARFTFFNEDNPNDSTSIVINYIVGNLGIDKNTAAAVSISNVYPNPATTTSYVDYKLPKSVANASLRVINLLGVTVTEIPLNRNEGKATIDVSNLKDGIYFYSLIVNNSATHTRKFVVKR